MAAELERRWNEALQAQAEQEKQLSAQQAVREQLGADEEQRLLELGQDLQRVWHHPDASAVLKKRILRTLIEEIIVDINAEPSEIRLRIHWAGGVHTFLSVRKNRTGEHQHTTEWNIVELIRDLAKVSPDCQIARLLNRMGYRTGTGITWTESRVRSVRSHRDIPPFKPEEPRAWLRCEEAAAVLGVRPRSVKRLLQKGILPAQHAIAGAPWVILKRDLDSAQVQAVVRAMRRGRHPPRPIPGQPVIPFESTM